MCESVAVADQRPVETGAERPASKPLFENLVSFLASAQNRDGGWGYRPGTQSRVEPTCWALLSLAKSTKSRPSEGAAQRGNDWLRLMQSPDGSWPAHPGAPEGCWATSLASLALHSAGGAEATVARGLAWVCNSWPREGNFWWQLRNRLRRGSSVVQQDSSLRGWSWVPGTASWVEPTAYALILFRNMPSKLHPADTAKRIRLAEAMLYDRMCPQGGWNLGNPRVYGVAGIPRIGPTAWALLALQGYPQRAETQTSLRWLESVYETIKGPGSLALAHICLQAYGRSLPPIEPQLARLYCAGEFLRNINVAAWASLALRPGQDWLRWQIR